jgi:hypothetical protein
MSEYKVSRALEEVWEWKEAVYEDTKDLTPEETIAYFHEGLKETARMMNAELVKNPDGSYRFVQTKKNAA